MLWSILKISFAKNSHSSGFLKLIDKNLINAAAHITGGGLTENLKRVIPNELYLDLNNIEYPEWCEWLKLNGELNDEEMKKIFNCGIGMVLFVDEDEELNISRRIKELKMNILKRSKKWKKYINTQPLFFQVQLRQL